MMRIRVEKKRKSVWIERNKDSIKGRQRKNCQKKKKVRGRKKNARRKIQEYKRKKRRKTNVNRHGRRIIVNK